MRALRAALLVLGLAIAAPVVSILPPVATAQAQEAAAPDYAKWERDALQAEAILEAGQASTVALEQMRSRVAEWRGQFASAKSSNEERIATL